MDVAGSPAHAGIDPNITAQIQTAPGVPPIPAETRCQTCSKRHLEYQKQARERVAQKREQASGQTRIF